jgi:transglutaminase-like putative cysteine protease
MNFKNVLILFFSGSFFLTIAKDDPKYPVMAIPENLKEGMYAVVREDFSRFEILGLSKTRYYTHKAITILNEKGKGYASKSIGYDKTEKVISISGYIYDAQGALIKRLKNSEIVDRSNYDGLFSDNRIKQFDLSQSTYPYTVEYEYETESNYLYSIPAFQYYTDDEVSIQQKSYEVQYPSNLKPRYKLNRVSAPKVEINGLAEKLIWSIENFKPEKFENYTASKTFPSVILAPSDFEYDGYKGSMKSWDQFGRWLLLINEGRGTLSEPTKQKVRELTLNLPNTEARVKALYEYLQNRTRYVSIQLGIGGLQTFPAATVEENGYGDCKALSNYTVALLKEAGIKGYYTVINSGDGAAEIETDFPSHQFDHVIVSVPNGKDTIWLECTSQTNPFGYTGNFTGNRWALMITEQGGKLVKTPQLKTEQNTQHQNAEVFLDKSGNATAKISTTYSGLQYENNSLDYYVIGNKEDQKKWLQKNIAIPSFEVSTFSFINKKDKEPSAIVKVDISLNRYASVSGKRIFLTPNLLNRFTSIPAKNENRKNPVYRRSSFVDVDSITFHLPEEIYPEFVPQPVKISSQYGEYESIIKFDQGKLLYVRKLKMKPGEFPAASYGEMVEFYKNISKSDNLKLVFLNKT